jgi:hypothetical protein
MSSPKQRKKKERAAAAAAEVATVEEAPAPKANVVEKTVEAVKKSADSLMDKIKKKIRRKKPKK